MLINETHLGPADTCKLPGYFVYRQDELSPNNRPYRGLVVAVKRRIPHQLLTRSPLSSMHGLGVEVCIANTPHRLFAAYKPPKSRLARADIHALLDSPHPTIIAGDLNARHPTWNPTSTADSDGNKLYNDSKTHGYFVEGPDAPTRYPPGKVHSPSTIDIVIHRGLRSQPTQEVLHDDLQSDHLPVLVVIPEHPARVNPPTPRYIINWKTFAEELQAYTPTRPITCSADVDLLTDELTTRIQEAFEAAKTTRKAVNRLPDLPRHIRNLIDEKRKVRVQWQHNRCPQLKTRLNRLIEQVKAELEAYNSDRWERYIDSIEDDWPALHRLCRLVTNTPEPVRPLLHNDGTPRYVAEDRAEIFAEHLERQFRPNPTTNTGHEAEIERHLHDYFTEDITPEEDPIFFTPGQVRKMILKTKPRKAPGADGITNSALRRLPQKTVAAMTRLFNGVMRTGHFPQRWKSGRVIMLPKAHKNTLKPESYRPITLLPTTSKVFEKLLLQHITPHLTPRPEQFGFRSKHSTTLQLTRVLHDFTLAKLRRENTVAVFLDMEKAFDRVWHRGLIYKVALSDSPRRVTRVIQSFLEDRRFHVMIEGKLSSERIITAGVPQGSCLSPTLYACYTDDIPVREDVHLALYADDIALYTSSISPKHATIKLQRNLDELPAWLSKWKLTVNVGKTQALMIKRSRQHTKSYPMKSLHIEMYDQRVPWATSAKYLGINIHKNLRMNKHVRTIVARTKIAAEKLRPIFSSKLPLNVKTTVYKMYIRSRLTYAAPAWYALTGATARRQLGVVQSRTLRKIVNAPRYVRNATIQRDLRIESLEDFVRRLSTKMFASADASIWPHLQNLAPLHARPPEQPEPALPRDLLAEANSATPHFTAT